MYFDPPLPPPASSVSFVQNMKLQTEPVIFSLCFIGVSLRRRLWLITKPVSCFFIDLLICDWCFISVCGSDARVYLKEALRPVEAAVRSGLSWALYERQKTRVWSEFKSDLLSLSSKSVNLFFFSFVVIVGGGGGGGGETGNSVSRLFPRRRGSTSRFTPGWSF